MRLILGFYARRHEHDKAKKVMVRLYGNIKDWDLEHEYEVVRRNVLHAERLREEQGTAPWREIFQGTNGYVHGLCGLFKVTKVADDGPSSLFSPTRSNFGVDSPSFSGTPRTFSVWLG